MIKSVLVLTVLAGVFGGSLADITCYSRTSTLTPTNNGTTVSCNPSAAFCYSFVDANGYHSAGCDTSCSSSVGSVNCYKCYTNYCNIVSPSGLTCYSRPNSYTNDTQSACPNGVTTCYIAAKDGSASCGGCTSNTANCYYCSTNLCNGNRNYNSATGLGAQMVTVSAVAAATVLVLMKQL